MDKLSKEPPKGFEQFCEELDAYEQMFSETERLYFESVDFKPEGEEL